MLEVTNIIYMNNNFMQMSISNGPYNCTDPMLILDLQWNPWYIANCNSLPD